MARKWFRSDVLSQRPLLSVTQVVILLLVVGAIVIALDLTQRAQAGRQAVTGVEAIQVQVETEVTRQVQLQATLDFVQSEDYVAAYARDEGGMIQPGEQRVVPLLLETTPQPTPFPAATPDPAYQARPWQAWWKLMTDAPPPTR
jgi:cell division protein FtsB